MKLEKGTRKITTMLVILSQNYSGEKHGGFLLNCTKIQMIVFCWKSRLYEKENKILYIANEEIGATTVDSR